MTDITKTRRLLLLDDEPNVIRALLRALRQCFPAGSLVIEAFTEPRLAVERLDEVAFAAIVSDYQMPGINGVDFLRYARDRQPDAVRLVLSASTDFNAVRDAVNLAEAFRYITKPWDLEDLHRVVEEALARGAAAIDQRRLADEARLRSGQISAAEHETRRLEAIEPGITQVRWGPNGEVILYDPAEE